MGVIERWRGLLGLDPAVDPVTLGEGDTPLVPLPRVAAALGAARVFAKFEGSNPTGSFKDRGMTVAISVASAEGARAVVCASTGNTAASAAAYAARAGLRCLVAIPSGAVALGKLAGALAHGARVAQIEGNFDAALTLVREWAATRPVTLVNSLNPWRIVGQQSAGFEICASLGRAPDWLALPVGNAGNITSYWRGFSRYDDAYGAGMPRVLGVQAAGAAPLVGGAPVDSPQTLATAIRIGRPARGDEALAAARDSGGRIVAVSDEEIVAEQRTLAREGLWVEPASAAGLAGLFAEMRAGRLDLGGQTVVCVCTGHGLKDPDAVTRAARAPVTVAPDPAALDALLEREE